MPSRMAHTWRMLRKCQHCIAQTEVVARRIDGAGPGSGMLVGAAVQSHGKKLTADGQLRALLIRPFICNEQFSSGFFAIVGRWPSCFDVSAAALCCSLETRKKMPSATYDVQAGAHPIAVNLEERQHGSVSFVRDRGAKRCLFQTRHRG